MDVEEVRQEGQTTRQTAQDESAMERERLKSETNKEVARIRATASTMSESQSKLVEQQLKNIHDSYQKASKKDIESIDPKNPYLTKESESPIMFDKNAGEYWIGGDGGRFYIVAEGSTYQPKRLIADPKDRNQIENALLANPTLPNKRDFQNTYGYLPYGFFEAKKAYDVRQLMGQITKASKTRTKETGPAYDMSEE
jgi:hypothetical protein